MNLPSISITQGVMGGDPCIGGTRIPVAGIVALFRDRRLTPKDIVRLYPDITEAEVEHAIRFALRFVERHEVEEAEDEAQEIETACPSASPEAPWTCPNPSCGATGPGAPGAEGCPFCGALVAGNGPGNDGIRQNGGHDEEAPQHPRVDRPRVGEGQPGQPELPTPALGHEAPLAPPTAAPDAGADRCERCAAPLVEDEERYCCACAPATDDVETAVPWVADEELIEFCADRVYRDLWLDDRPREQENMKSHLRVARAVIGALREKGWGPSTPSAPAAILPGEFELTPEQQEESRRMQVNAAYGLGYKAGFDAAIDDLPGVSEPKAWAMLGTDGHAYNLRWPMSDDDPEKLRDQGYVPLVVEVSSNGVES